MSYSTEETTKELGYMIIFNQEVFEKFDNRIGSQKDVTSLKATFSKFGMDPIAKESLRLNDIENEINMLSIKDFTGYKLFMCVLLTHGEEKDIVWAKDRTFNLQEKLINPIIKNTTLNGVPKIFIIVACRGKEHSYFAESDYVLEEDGCTLSNNHGVDYSNVLICYSTYAGHLSWRNPHYGTYYIMKLCTLIQEKGANTEFHLLLLELNKSLIKDKLQVAPFQTSMQKQLFLKDLLISNNGMSYHCNIFEDFETWRKSKLYEISEEYQTITLTEPKTIVICGETGVGKSTLGNFILKVLNPEQESPFKVMHRSRPSPMSDNVVATISRAQFKVNVIETPGFGDTEGDQLNALNVCNIWKAFETDKVAAVLFLFKSRFTPITKIWHERVLKVIPEQHQKNVFIVHTQYGGDESDKQEDLLDISRLSGNPNARISHVLNSSRLDDHREEILRLINEWTSLPSFTVKNLKPPEIVYEEEQFGPIEHRFWTEWVDVKPRKEILKFRKLTINDSRNGGIGERNDLVEEIYTIREEIRKEIWIKFRNKYRVRFDKTRDFLGEDILEHYVKHT